MTKGQLWKALVRKRRHHLSYRMREYMVTLDMSNPLLVQQLDEIDREWNESADFIRKEILKRVPQKLQEFFYVDGEPKTYVSIAEYGIENNLATLMMGNHPRKVSIELNILTDELLFCKLSVAMGENPWGEAREMYDLLTSIAKSKE